MTIIEEIAAERERQRAKWSDDHDDGHLDGALAAAGSLVAHPWPPERSAVPAPEWSTALRAKHPRRKQLVVAAALIVAEIERMDRGAP